MSDCGVTAQFQRMRSRILSMIAHASTNEVVPTASDLDPVLAEISDMEIR
jgi:hypothetical protein